MCIWTTLISKLPARTFLAVPIVVIYLMTMSQAHQIYLPLTLFSSVRNLVTPCKLENLRSSSHPSGFLNQSPLDLLDTTFCDSSLPCDPQNHLCLTGTISVGLLLLVGSLASRFSLPTYSCHITAVLWRFRESRIQSLQLGKVSLHSLSNDWFPSQCIWSVAAQHLLRRLYGRNTDFLLFTASLCPQKAHSSLLQGSAWRMSGQLHANIFQATCSQLDLVKRSKKNLFFFSILSGVFTGWASISQVSCPPLWSWHCSFRVLKIGATC